MITIVYKGVKLTEGNASDLRMPNSTKGQF